MDVTIAREGGASWSRRLLVLATVGLPPARSWACSATVWGIMTSFQSIAASKNTSLAVGRPRPFAEALFRDRNRSRGRP